MSKDKLTDYDSTTASNNTDVGGISVAEGMLPSAVNNSIRELTKQLGAFADGTDGIDVLSLADDDASHAIKLQAPSAVTADTTFTLPDGDGVSGQTMITDGAGALSWAAPYGNRNLIINGAMQVAQRGTSGSTPSTNNYLLDRFFLVRVGGYPDNATQTQESDTPAGHYKSFKMVRNSAHTLTGTNASGFVQTIEGQNIAHLNWGTSSAQTVTVSFWVKSNKTGDFSFIMTDSNSAYDIGKLYNIASVNTWEYKTINIEAPTSGTFNTDNTAGMYLTWGFGAVDAARTAQGTTWGTSNSSGSSKTMVTGASTALATDNGATFQITGVQLEVGDTATPFDHSRSYADELLRCQRYCFAQARYGDGNIGLDSGGSTRLRSARHSGNASFVFYQYPVMMRANPDLTFTDNSSGDISDYSNAGTAHLYDSGDTAFYLYDFIAEAEL